MGLRREVVIRMRRMRYNSPLQVALITVDRNLRPRIASVPRNRLHPSKNLRPHSFPQPARMRSFTTAAVVLVLLLAVMTGSARASQGQEEGHSRKLRGWGGYSGSWSGSWGSTSVNVQPGGQSSGSVNTPYYSGSWGNGGSSGSSNSQSTPSPPTTPSTQSTSDSDADKAAADRANTAAQAPGKVYYNGYGVLVEKLPNGSVLTVVNNNYTDVTVLSAGRRRD